jgi:hypothetical protein
MEILYVGTVRKYIKYTKKEIEAALLKGNWYIGYDWRLWFSRPPCRKLFREDIMARAITYGETKHPGRPRETGLFATLIEGYTTGMFGGFGQDQEPLYGLAEEVMNAASYVCPPPAKNTKKHRAFTERAIVLLDAFIYGSPDDLGDNIRYEMTVAKIIELCGNADTRRRVSDELTRLRSIEVTWL